MFQSIVKTALITCCCVAIVVGSLTFRYVSFAAEAFNLQGRQAWADTERSAVQEDLAVSVEENIAQPTVVTDRAAVDKVAAETGNLATDSEGNTELAMEAMGGSLSSVGQSTEADMALSEERIQAAMEKITWRDKLEALVMLVTRLDTDAIMELEEMSRGGFTTAEKQRAKEMMNKYYDEDEVRKIRQLYWEYVR